MFSVVGASGALARVGDSWALVGLRSNEAYSFRGGGHWRGDEQGFATWQVFTEDDPYGEFGGPAEMVVWPPRTLPDEEVLSSRLFEREGVLYVDLGWRPRSSTSLARSSYTRFGTTPGTQCVRTATA